MANFTNLIDSRILLKKKNEKLLGQNLNLNPDAPFLNGNNNNNSNFNELNNNLPDTLNV